MPIAGACAMGLPPPPRLEDTKALRMFNWSLQMRIACVAASRRRTCGGERQRGTRLEAGAERHAAQTHAAPTCRLARAILGTGRVLHHGPVEESGAANLAVWCYLVEGALDLELEHLTCPTRRREFEAVEDTAIKVVLCPGELVHFCDDGRLLAENLLGHVAVRVEQVAVRVEVLPRTPRSMHTAQLRTLSLTAERQGGRPAWPRAMAVPLTPYPHHRPPRVRAAPRASDPESLPRSGRALHTPHTDPGNAKHIKPRD
jgi:hypothetical protein